MDKKETLNPDWLEKYAHRVIEHLNEDHQNTIVSTLNAQLKIEILKQEWLNCVRMATSSCPKVVVSF